MLEHAGYLDTFNIEADPREERPILESASWALGQYLRIFDEYKALLVIMFYPLSEYDGNVKTTDWSSLPSFPAPPSDDGGESKWVKPKLYFDQLPNVMKLVPPLPGEETIHARIHSVWDAASKAPEIKKALVDSFVESDKKMSKQRPSFFYCLRNRSGLGGVPN